MLFSSQYQPVSAQDLIDSFYRAGVIDFDFEAAFRSWELQAGYPVINVIYDQQSRRFWINQQRYLTFKNQTTDEPSHWIIPLNFAIQSDSDFLDTRITNYFPSNVDMFTVTAPAAFDSSQWFIFNKQQLGYYRVNYDASNWNALTAALNSDEFNQIHVLNRAQLIDDALNFANGGYLEYDVLIGILTYLSRETEYTPWYSADRFISTLYQTFGSLNEDLNVRIESLTNYVLTNKF